MPPVFLDGIRLPKDQVKLLMNLLGELDETCELCGGSVIEIRSVVLRSDESPAKFFTWCSTCGSFSQFRQQVSENWVKRIASSLVADTVWES